MTAYDDLTDSSPEGPASSEAESLADQPGGAAQTPGEIGGSDDQVDPSGDPGGDTDLGDALGGGADDETSEGPGVDSSDADRGNLDGSTPGETSREESLDDASDAVRDPSGAGPDEVGASDLASYTDAGDSGQDNGLNE
ncbi:MAG: hypothetical protein HOQ18_02695 [Dermatophilaceae bacterium]|nr:hypothetical protein [Dermatophilaceae bacterium]NUO89729.1 hypothetical protein [Dermatophilaceae bacterium]NUQ32740.1 hypothetical protein [Dermatophilaceae bacterium]NUR16829.1 hypothetical protein [Dermatophilaceae bacterium]NUR81215.1 hypothetical protein [Dermatophilaceae bacterium]